MRGICTLWILGLGIAAQAQLPPRAVLTARPDTVQLRLCSQAAAYYYERDLADSMQWFVQKGALLAHKHITAHTASMLYMTAMYYRSRNQYDSSLYYCKKTLNLLTQQGEITYCARVRYGLTVILADRYEYASAFTQALENIKFYEKHKYDKWLIPTYDLLIAVCGELGLQKRENLYIQKRKEAELFGKNKGKDQDFLFFLNEGFNLEKKAKYREAQTFYTKALNIARRDKMLYQITDSYYCLAKNLYLQQRYEQALRMAQLAYRFSIRDKAVIQEANIHIIMAQIYVSLEKPQESLRSAQKAYRLALKSARADLLIPALSVFIRAQKLTGNFSGALQNHETLTALKDSLSIQQQVHTIEFLEAEQEIKLRQAKEQQLTKDIQIKQLRLSQLQLDKHLAWMVAAVALLIVALAIYFWQRTLRNNQQLQVQKQQIQLQAEQLAESNRVKNVLFGIIGHDLRSPLASFKTQLYLLENQLLVPEKVNKVIDSLQNGLNQLSITTDNLLFWSLNEQDKIRPKPQKVALSSVIEETVQLFTGIIVDKELWFEEDVNDLWVCVDEQHIRIVLSNILQNAIKFSPPKGIVKVTGKAMGDSILMQVSNRIADEAKSLKGTGLGLHLVKELMQKNGGTYRQTILNDSEFEIELKWLSA